jgi:hypothetical protein
VEIRLISLDWGYRDGQNYASAVSFDALVLWETDTYVYITSGLYTVGSRKVDVIARAIVSEFDKGLVAIRRQVLSRRPTSDPDMAER